MARPRGPSRPGPSPAQLVLGAEAGAVPETRRFTRAYLQGCGADLVADAEIVVTELVTNARLHGEPPVVVRINADGQRVRFEVQDMGRALPVEALQRPDAMTGRGLSLIATLAAAWGADPVGPAGKIVWAELMLAGPAPGRSVAPPEIDREAILASWLDDGDEPSRFTVRLGPVPTELLLSAKTHIENVVRELTLLRTGRRADGADLAPPLAGLIQAATVDFAEALREMKRLALAAARQGERVTELELHLPLSAADAAERYLGSLAEADRYAREARLLTLAPPTSHRVFRRWYVHSLADQLRALAAGRTAPRPKPLALVLADEVDWPLTAGEASGPPGSAVSRFLQATVDAARDGVLAVSPDRRVLAVNRRFCELWDLPPGSVKVGEPSPALGPAQRSRVLDPEAFEAALRWGHEHPDEAQALDVALKDGRVIEGYSAPILDDLGTYHGRVWFLRDDTAQRAADTQRAALLEELAAVQRSQRFLLDASAVLARASGFSETLESLAQAAVPTLGDLCLIDVVDDRGRITRMAAVHADPARRAVAAKLRAYPPDPAGAHPSSRVIRDGASLWAAEMPEEFLVATTRDAEHLAVLRELDFTSFMSVPLVANGQTLGALTMVSCGPGRRLGPSDLAIAENLAERVALVVGKERRYDFERKTSHALQAALLPHRLPPLRGVRLAVRHLPGTRDTEVGGDFWDVGTAPGGEISFAVGDVAGHDVTAAASMAQLRSACRVLRPEAPGPGELAQLLQARWGELDLDRIATALFAQLDPVSRRLRVASAGHPPPLVVSEGEAWFPSLDVAPPLGAPQSPGLAGSTWETALPRRSALVLFTDGLVEDRHRSIDYGMQRLAETAAAAASSGPDELADRILATVPGEDRGDDVALLVVSLD